MLEIQRRILTDELDRKSMKLLEEWDKLPPIYDPNNQTSAKKYENIAGTLNHIEKCKNLLW